MYIYKKSVCPRNFKTEAVFTKTNIKGVCSFNLTKNCPLVQQIYCKNYPLKEAALKLLV